MSLSNRGPVNLGGYYRANTAGFRSRIVSTVNNLGSRQRRSPIGLADQAPTKYALTDPSRKREGDFGFPPRDTCGTLAA